jgi:hypothetical protein
MLMPRADYEALERRRDARWARGQDPDVATDKDSDSNEEEADKEAAVERNAEDEVHQRTIANLTRLLSINQGAATALFDDQDISGLHSLRNLKDKMAKDVCQAVIKPGRDLQGYPFPVLSQVRLKLLAFWARHLWRTSREPDDWLDTPWYKIQALESQRELEDSYKNAKPPTTPELTLDQGTAAASFVQIRAYLRKCRSLTSGLPLDYVIRAKIKGPHDEPEAKEPDPPPFGDIESPYVSYDDEMVHRAPILRTDLTLPQLNQEPDVLKTRGPFDNGFLTDSAVVFNILHTICHKSSWWTHCKPFEKTKNGRQAFRTLHAQLLGGKKVVTSGSAIMTKIQTLRYDGDKARFTFDKYVQLHVEQHNLHKDLEEYGIDALGEELKILWFEQGIKTTALDAVKASILTNKTNNQTFQAVQDAYIDYYRKIAPNDPLKARQVATVHAGRRTGTPRRSSGGQGSGHDNA